MVENSLAKLSEFIIYLEDEAKRRGIDAYPDIPKKTSWGDWYTVMRFTIYNSPPDLGIHIKDGMGTKDKVGG